MEKALKYIHKKTLKVLFPSPTEIVDSILISEFKDAKRIIDLGCGPSSPIGRVKDKLQPDLYLLGVDIYDPYLEANKKVNIHSEYLKSNIFDVSFPDKSFDGAILLDVIEHFDKQDFLDFLPKLNKMAKKIIVMTPNGWIDQEEYDNNAYQAHRSGWTADEMRALGFEVYGISGLKSLRGKFGLPKIKPAFIGNIISNISEPFIRNKPEKAFHIICIKHND